jgi:hypothetical protein
VRGQDAELLAVLGDRPPRDREAALLQGLGDFLIGLRLAASSAARMSWIIFLTETDDTISPSPAAMPLWKKYFSSNSPCGVSTYLFVVTRLIVDSCMPMSSPTSRSDKGRR